MDFLIALLLFTASMVCCMAGDIGPKTTFGESKPGTGKFGSKDVYFFGTATVSFNKDKKFDLIIDKVVVLFLRKEVQSEITEGGPNHSFLTLQLKSTIDSETWAAVYIYGRMNEGYQEEIKKSDIKLN